MGPDFPISARPGTHDGISNGPSPLHWGDSVWDPIVEPILSALQAEFDRSVRGGPVFAIVVQHWKYGGTLGSNTEIGDRLGWDKSEVAEGFRLIRERLKAWNDPVVDIRVREYTRDLLITPTGGLRSTGDFLLSVAGRGPEVAGQALAGAMPIAKGRGARVICEQPADAEEQARALAADGYAGYLILPLDETDDFDSLARLRGRAALLDVASRHGDLPCITFDYAGAGLYATQQLLELDCSDIVVLTREHDSRTFSIAEGYRRALRRSAREPRRPVTVNDDVVDTLCSLQAQGLLRRAEGRKLGILCADGDIGEGVLRYLDGVDAGSWNLAVAVVGGKRWAARHWAELIWAELNYQELAAAGIRYLLGAQGASVPQVQPRYERWFPRKPAASSPEIDQEIWRPVLAC